MSAAPRVGDPAPAFRLDDAFGNPVDSGSFGGKPLLMFFFPKASTPG